MCYGTIFATARHNDASIVLVAWHVESRVAREEICRTYVELMDLDRPVSVSLTTQEKNIVKVKRILTSPANPRLSGCE